MSRAMGQNSLTPQSEQNSLTPLGNNNLNFRLARDQAVHLETAANLFASPPHENNFFAVMATECFQKEPKKKFNSFFGKKNSKSTDKATYLPVKTLRDFYKEKNLDENFQDLAIKS